MKNIARLQIKERTELFQATAISMGMQPNVVEKDFWVCFMIDHLFHNCSPSSSCDIYIPPRGGNETK